jgi:chemotaxis protein histidine kinase CheA
MPLSQDDQVKYKDLYLQTAREYVKALQENLNFLMQGKESDDAIETLHRSAHSLNTQSIMMSFQQMSSVASLLEKIFKEHREKNQPISHDSLVVLVSTVNSMDHCLTSIEETNHESDLSADVTSLHNENLII